MGESDRIRMLFDVTRNDVMQRCALGWNCERITSNGYPRGGNYRRWGADIGTRTRQTNTKEKEKETEGMVDDERQARSEKKGEATTWLSRKKGVGCREVTEGKEINGGCGGKKRIIRRGRARG